MVEDDDHLLWHRPAFSTLLFSSNFVVFKPQKPRNYVMKIIGKVAGFSFLNLPSIDHSDESRVPSDSNKWRCKQDMLMDDRHIKLDSSQKISKHHALKLSAN